MDLSLENWDVINTSDYFCLYQKKEKEKQKIIQVLIS